MINVNYDKLECFVLYNSDSVLKTRRNLFKQVHELKDNQHLNFEVKNVTFGIDKHSDMYDVEILKDGTYLTPEQVNQLHDKLINLLMEREDSRIDNADIKYTQYFETYFLKRVAEKYLKKVPTQSFYSYAEEYIIKYV
jgi:hypothetical protein